MTTSVKASTPNHIQNVPYVTMRVATKKKYVAYTTTMKDIMIQTEGKMAENAITIQRVKPQGKYCESCLKKRVDINRLYEFHLMNYGCNRTLNLCDACLKDMFDLEQQARNSKGEIFKNSWVEREGDNTV